MTPEQTQQLINSLQPNVRLVSKEGAVTKTSSFEVGQDLILVGISNQGNGACWSLELEALQFIKLSDLEPIPQPKQKVLTNEDLPADWREFDGALWVSTTDIDEVDITEDVMYILSKLGATYQFQPKTIDLSEALEDGKLIEDKITPELARQLIEVANSKLNK